MHHIVDADCEQRLDNYLFKHYRHIPKSYIYRLLRTGQIRINKKRAKPSQKLHLDDYVRVPPMLLEQHKATRTPNISDAVKQKCHAWIVHEDEAMLVIDKPPGIAAHTDTHGNPGVIELLQATMNMSLYLAHRIDKETSGLLLIAKTRPDLVVLNTQFKERQVQKTYQALVAGTVSWRTRRIEASLTAHKNTTHSRVVVDPHGKSAITEFTCVRTDQHTSHIIATPLTGRMHQLRVHLQLIGTPIIGDPLYMPQQHRQQWQQKGFKRLCLHALAISYQHPRTNELCTSRSRYDMFAQHAQQAPHYHTKSTP